MNTELLTKALQVMTEKLANAEVQNALLTAELTILKEEQHNATTNNES